MFSVKNKTSATIYLYRLFNACGALLYVGISKHTLYRVYGHRQKHWFDSIARITIEKVGAVAEAQKREKEVIASEHPIYNVSKGGGYTPEKDPGAMCSNCGGTGIVPSGEELKTIRKLSNKTLLQVASQMGISQSFLSDLEHNRRNVTFDLFQKFLKAVSKP